jgi:hypothetical protein
MKLLLFVEKLVRVAVRITFLLEINGKINRVPGTHQPHQCRIDLNTGKNGYGKQDQ